MQKVPIDKTYLRNLFISHKKYLKQIFSAEKKSQVDEIIKNASNIQVNVVLRILYLIIHEGKFCLLLKYSKQEL